MDTNIHVLKELVGRSRQMLLDRQTSLIERCHTSETFAGQVNASDSLYKSELIEFREQLSDYKNHQIISDLWLLLADGQRIDETLTYWTDIAINKVINLLRSVLDVCYIHLFHFPGYKQIESFCKKYFDLALLDRLEDTWKYHSTYAAYRLMQQEDVPECEGLRIPPPDRPSWMPSWELDGFLLGGWFQRRINLFVLRSKRTGKITAEQLSLAHAIFDSKRGCLPISKDKVQQSLLKHSRAMEGLSYEGLKTGKTGYSGFVELFSREEMLENINSKVRWLASNCIGKINPINRVPSPSAHYGCPRKYGGFHAPLECLSTIDFNCPFTLREKNKKPVVKSIRFVVNRPFQELIGMASYGPRLEFVYGTHPEDTLAKVKDIFGQEKIKVADVHSILEPFKARIITAGPGATYHLSRMIQKPLHTRLKRYHCFRLCGEPLSESIINETYNYSQFDKIGFPGVTPFQFGKFIHSADYAAATDGLHPSIGENYVNTILLNNGHWSPEHVNAFKNSMQGHLIKYNPYTLNGIRMDGMNQKYGKGDEFSVQQTHGQLMGSPSSFPALCVANCAMLWAATEEYLGMFVEDNYYNLSFYDLMSVCHPLFNGDDASFLTNKDHWRLWEKYARVAGLTPSVGKSYSSNQFIMLNSETYFRESTDNYFRYVPALNPGLVKGVGKVMSDTRVDDFGVQEDEKKLNSAGDQLETCLEGFGECHRERIKELFIDHNMEKLKSSKRSWILPKELGGLGLPFGTANYSQRKLAGGILMGVDFGNLKTKASTSFSVDWGNSQVSILKKRLKIKMEEGKLIKSPIDDFVKIELPDLSKFCNSGLCDEDDLSSAKRFSKALIEALSKPFINPIADDLIGAKYFYYPAQPDRAIKMY